MRPRAIQISAGLRLFQSIFRRGIVAGEDQRQERVDGARASVDPRDVGIKRDAARCDPRCACARLDERLEQPGKDSLTIRGARLHGSLQVETIDITRRVIVVADLGIEIREELEVRR